jgi:TRAP-type transport system periplasmic protein
MMTTNTVNKRRMMLKALGGGLAGLAAGGSLIAVAQQAKPWRFGHQFAVDHPVALGASKVSEVIAQRSGGRLKIDIFPSGQLGTGKELDQQVSDDSLDFSIDGPGILSAWVRPLSIFEAPFIARDWNHLVKMIESPWSKAQFKELADKHNLQICGRPWYYGTRQLTTRDRSVRMPGDAKGLKIRVPDVPTFMDMVRAMGATPTPMALAEVYLSLQTGVVDGQENPLPTINSAKFYEVQKYLNLTGHIITPQIPLMSARRWNALSAADRALVGEAFDAGAAVSDASFRALEAKLTDEFRAKGMTIVDADRPAFQAAMKPVYEKYEAIWGKGVFEQLQALK